MSEKRTYIFIPDNRGQAEFHPFTCDKAAVAEFERWGQRKMLRSAALISLKTERELAKFEDGLFSLSTVTRAEFASIEAGDALEQALQEALLAFCTRNLSSRLYDRGAHEMLADELFAAGLMNVVNALPRAIDAVITRLNRDE